MPFQIFVSYEVIGLLKLIVAGIVTICVLREIRKIAEKLDGRRELHHYVHQPESDNHPQFERGEDDGAPYYRRELR